MAILLRFGPQDLLRCRFAMSPLWEMTAAIRTLAEPGRQVHHLPWLRQVQPELERLELGPLLALEPRVGYTPDFLAPPPTGPVADFAGELARVRHTPLDQVAAELARCARERQGDPSQAALALAADPAAALALLTNLLDVRVSEACWRAVVAPTYQHANRLLTVEGSTLRL